MANPVVQNYLNDEGIDYNKRLGVINAIKAGQSPDEIGNMISQKYGNKYSTGVSPTPITSPQSPSDKVGNVIAGGLKALNPANLASTVSGAEQAFGQAAPKIGQALGAIGQTSGDTPDDQAAGQVASQQRETDNQAQVDSRASNVQYLNSKGVVPQSEGTTNPQDPNYDNTTTPTNNTAQIADKTAGAKAIYDGTVGDKVVDAAGQGLNMVGKGIQQYGTGMYNNTKNLLNPATYNLEKNPDGSIKWSDPTNPIEQSADQANKDLSQGFQGIVGGSMQTAFSPITGTIEAAPDIIKNPLKTAMNVPNVVVGNIVKSIIPHLRPDMSQEDIENNIVKPMQLALQVGMVASAGEGAEAAANDALKTKLTNQIPDLIKSGDIAGASDLLDQYDKAINTKTTALGRTAAAISGGVGGAANFFGEKTGLSDLVNKSADELKADAMTKGLEEQNTRLKTVNKAFRDNTKIYKDANGAVTQVTPVDTLSKLNAYPEIDKGNINMGDYKIGEGALGKIKTQVESLDDQIDSTLKASGKTVPLEDLRQQAVDKIKNNPDMKAAGTVATNVNKVNTRFDDYQQSYGDEIDITDINKMRKVANQDWSPDTQDVSRVVGDVARDQVYNATDDMAVKNLLKQQSELISAKNYAEKLNGTKVTGGRLSNYVARTTGAVVGASVKGLPFVGPILGMLGGDFISKALQQSQFTSVGGTLKGLFEKGSEDLPTPLPKGKKGGASPSFG